MPNFFTIAYMYTILTSSITEYDSRFCIAESTNASWLRRFEHVCKSLYNIHYILYIIYNLYNISTIKKKSTPSAVLHSKIVARWSQPMKCSAPQ